MILVLNSVVLWGTLRLRIFNPILLRSVRRVGGNLKTFIDIMPLSTHPIWNMLNTYTCLIVG